jgi:small subunit ribosomal protein S1
MVLEIDEDKRRISLGMKQCKANPWEEFSANVKRGDKVKGPVKSITDFGVFVGLAAGIDGLVHLSDLSWNEPGESRRAQLQEGPGRRGRRAGHRRGARAHLLGIKQLDTDPFTSYTTLNDRGATVTARSRRSTRAAPRSSSTTTSPATCAPPRSAATASKMPATC